MGLFNFKRKRKPEANKPMLGMILLADENSMDIDKVVAELKEKWMLSVDSSKSDKNASVLIIEDYRIAIANMSMPIPGDEIESTAKYNYYWQNGVDEATKHKGHVLLSILNPGKNLLKENIIFNQVAASILNNSNALGVYVGSRTLLLEKKFYLTNTVLIFEKSLPLNNWIYFGLRQEGETNSIYTYGLSEFNKSEMEILNSNHSLAELKDIMYNLTHYVISQNVTLKSGQTIGMTAEQKLEISFSKGKYLEGKTIKVKY